jgi:Flp pilus assembly pilin Flp
MAGKFLRDRRAVTALEYAAIAALMMMVLATALVSEAQAYKSTFLKLANTLQAADSGSSGTNFKQCPEPPAPKHSK